MRIAPSCSPRPAKAISAVFRQRRGILGYEAWPVEREQEITVAIIDDHTLIRAGLRAILDRQPGIRVVGDAADSDSVVRLARSRRPAVLLLDLHLPAALPATDISALKSQVPSTAIILLTVASEPRRARALLRAGASGYVLKQSREEKLIEAILTVAAGGIFVDSKVREEIGRLESDPLDGLNDREVSLLRLLALGHTNREVSERLFLSVRTIEVTKARLMKKLCLESRADLVRCALDSGLIEPGI